MAVTSASNGPVYDPADSMRTRGVRVSAADPSRRKRHSRFGYQYLSVSLLAQFLLAWLIGFPAILLAVEVDPRFGAACVVSGLLLIGGAIRALGSERDWERFVASQRARPGGFAYPSGRDARLWFAAGFSIIGAGFVLGGVLGVLAIFGLYDFPRQ